MEALATMLRYEAYKDSGEGWIEKVPSHWQVRKLKHLFFEKKHTRNLNLNSGAISFGEVVTKDDEKITLATKASYQEVLSGEFLINPLNLNYDLKSLRIALSKKDVVVSAGYIVIKEKVGINKEYFKYLLHRYDVAYMKLLGSGVRQTINFNHIANSLLIVPPKKEQATIAKFLDQKTTQIDEAIAIKEKQIELLKERKQILVQKVVTQGLEPSESLMETDLSWAPKIAPHWSLLPNRQFMKIRRVPVGLAHKSYQVLSLTKQGILVRDLTTGAGKQSDFLERMQEVRKGNLIFCLFDVEETPRTVGLSGYSGMISADYTIFECIDEPTGRFLEYFYKNIDDQKLLRPLYKGLRNRIPKPRFLRTNCPMPPKEELIEILQYLDNLEVNTSNSIAMILSQVEKLKEYRTTLINSAVTGKIRVPIREVASAPV